MLYINCVNNTLAAMMKKRLFISLIFGSSISAFALDKHLELERKLIEHFQKQTWGDALITSDSLYLSPFKEKFNVPVSDNYIEFDTTHLVIKNPYFNGKYENDEEEKKNMKNYKKY